jgi:hypothetical protein
MVEERKPTMSIFGKLREWWAARNAVPEEKTKLLRERIEKLFEESRKSHESSRRLKREGQPCEPARGVKV